MNNGVVTVAVDEFLMVLDGNGVVVQWSRRAEKLVGCTAEEVVGQPVAHLVARIAARARSDAGPGVDRRAVGDLRVRPVHRRDGTVGWTVFQAARGGAAVADVQAAAAEAWFAHAPFGLYVLDSELRIVSADLTTQIMGGVPPERVLGRRLTDVYSLAAPSQIESMLREVLDSGVPAPARVVRMGLKDGPERGYWAGLSAFRLEDQLGAVLGVGAVVADAGELDKRRSRIRLLSELRAQVGRTLDVMAACQDLADALVPDFADIAVVEVVDSVIRGEDPPLAPLGREVPLRRAAFSSSGEPPVQAHPVGDLRALPFPSPYAQALTDLKPRVLDLAPDMPWLSADPARGEAIRASGARALITVPVALHGAVLGLLTLYRAEQLMGSFDENEVDFLVGLAAKIALSIDRARLYRREHTIAATVQRQLLPARPCSQTGIETARAQVFGDAGGGGWSDSFTVAGARTALAVGEISGQGIQAAAAMGELRTVVRSLARLDLEPDELLACLNDTTMLLAAERAALPPSDPSQREPLTASGVYAIYDPIAQTCTYARAHHPAPVIVSPDGTAVQVPDAPARAPPGHC
ncbi:MAG TPA: SpoIIE family protein phosphatase [Streptosporangiaceae bacterium]|nr:SpoIIE family protein phosphatase [Streptosporangiaceae bacterium]